MVGPKVALLLFGLAAVSALPQPEERSRWPDRPDWWPDSLPWPPARPEGWPDQPSWWPDSLPWPPQRPDGWPDRPSWWPDNLPWPPQRPDGWPDRPSWWPDSLPWPPQRPDGWPDRPSWWPDNLPWPPQRPDGWPDRPSWWPDNLPWPPQRPDGWPDRPSWWPDNLPWPPQRPDGWPDRPSWWPESLPWPPALPEQWPDRPSWWPESLPWPPALPEEIPWPPPGVNPDRIPYIPSRDNQFHLFTRQNPQISQPLMINNEYLLTYSNYNNRRPTKVLVHDHEGSAIDSFNALLVPAFLAAGDVNVIVVDWSVGANASRYLSAFYSVLSGNFVARFIDWLTYSSYGDVEDFQIVGLGLGALNAGWVSRRLGSRVGYVTALDPSQGPSITGLLPPLSLNVAKYVEVIHTDIANRGYSQPLGHVDFYPNGGAYMPGCGGDSQCNRNRAVYYFAESLQTGGFTGIECATHYDAANSACDLPGRLNMGGHVPKTGSKGVYWVGVNPTPPFSQG